MQISASIVPSLSAHLRQSCPDTARLYFAYSVLQDRYLRFVQGFNGLVTYAVKANAHPLVLDNLAAACLTAFDVASPVEMQAFRTAVPNAVLHYHNPVRSRVQVATTKRFGVQSWSIDSATELDKLGALPPGSVIAVRLHLPVTGAAYDFGMKFGAEPAQVAALLRLVTERGLTPSLTFHPGTQCTDLAAWISYIDVAYALVEQTSTRLKRLNVGGGFAAQRDFDAPDLERVFASIKGRIQALFGTKAPALVCEPGRAMVAPAFTLVTRIKALRGAGTLFLNDGIYGLMTEFRDLGLPARYHLWRDGAPITGPKAPFTVFGPTCDSLDQLPQPLDLPICLQEGDCLLFPEMGAYSVALATRFNGYGCSDIVVVGRL